MNETKSSARVYFYLVTSISWTGHTAQHLTNPQRTQEVRGQICDTCNRWLTGTAYSGTHPPTCPAYSGRADWPLSKRSPNFLIMDTSQQLVYRSLSSSAQHHHSASFRNKSETLNLDEIFTPRLCHLLFLFTNRLTIGGAPPTATEEDDRLLSCGTQYGTGCYGLVLYQFGVWSFCRS